MIKLKSKFLDKSSEIQKKSFEIKTSSYEIKSINHEAAVKNMGQKLRIMKKVKIMK